MNLLGLLEQNATAIYNILNDTFLKNQIKTEITITKISDHFPIFLITDPITSSGIKTKEHFFMKE